MSCSIRYPLVFIVLLAICYQTTSACNKYCAVYKCDCCRAWNACIDCESGYYLTGERCKECSNSISNCKTCTSSSVCTSCKTNYFKSSPTSCPLCSSFIANCLTCTTSAICTACANNNYYLTSSSTCNLCSTAMDKCRTCSSNSKCLTCFNSSYGVNSTNNGCQTCSSLIPSCLECQSASQCTLCVSNTFLSSNGTQCKACSLLIGNCSVCTNSTYCSQCANLTQFFVEKSNKCKPCTQILDYCLQCNSSAVCNICSPNISAINSESQCSLCSDLLPNCLYCLSNSSCSSCIDSTYVLASNGTCITCSEMNKGCISCNGTSCLSCKESYFLNSSALCQKCQDILTHCVSCNSSSTCLLCEDTSIYILNSSAMCQICGEIVIGCELCTSNFTCSSCLQQYYLNSSNLCEECAANIPWCLYCTSSTACQTCDNTTLFFNPNSSACQLCANYLINCTQCSSISTCTKCMSSPNIMTTSIGSCIYCLEIVQKCIECSSQTYCTKCSQNYLLMEFPTKCVPCFQKIYGCVKCTGASTCTSCNIGQVVLNGCSSVAGCIEVQSNLPHTSLCILCDSTQFQAIPIDGICKCKAGHLAGRACTTIIGCTSAIKGQSCLMCNSNKLFVLKNGTCLCRQGFQLQGEICVQKCGDGRLYKVGCDDGNNINGDGCSSICQIQANYDCTQGTESSSSRCIYEGMIKLQYYCSYKSDGNTAQILIKTNPVISAIQKMDLNSRVQITASQGLFVDSITYSQGIIFLNILYFQDIENTQFLIKLQFDKNYIKSPKTAVKFNIVECHSNYLLYSQIQQSSNKEIFMLVSKCLGYITVIVWFVASFSHRMIGVETLNTVQFAAILFSFASYYLPNYAYLYEIRNTLDLYKSNVSSEHDSSVQVQLYRLNSSPNFTENTLTIGLVSFGGFLSFVIIEISKKMNSKDQKIIGIDQQSIKNIISKSKLYESLVFPSFIGFFMNIVFSCFISCFQSNNISDKSYGFYCLYTNSMVILTIIIFFKDFRYLFIESNHYKQSLKCKEIYPPFYLCNLLTLTIVYISSFSNFLSPFQTKVISIVIISLKTIFILIIRPYYHTIHNIGLVLNELGLIFLLILLIRQKRDDEYQVLYVIALEIWLIAVLIWALIRTIFEFKQNHCPQEDLKINADLIKAICSNTKKVENQMRKRFHDEKQNLVVPLTGFFQKSIRGDQNQDLQNIKHYLRKNTNSRKLAYLQKKQVQADIQKSI